MRKTLLDNKPGSSFRNILTISNKSFRVVNEKLEFSIKIPKPSGKTLASARVLLPREYSQLVFCNSNRSNEPMGFCYGRISRCQAWWRNFRAIKWNELLVDERSGRNSVLSPNFQVSCLKLKQWTSGLDETSFHRFEKLWEEFLPAFLTDFLALLNVRLKFNSIRFVATIDALGLHCKLTLWFYVFNARAISWHSRFKLSCFPLKVLVTKIVHKRGVTRARVKHETWTFIVTWYGIEHDEHRRQIGFSLCFGRWKTSSAREKFSTRPHRQL